MSKWHGKIGFSIQYENESEEFPDVYENDIVERKYYGDILQNSRRWQSSEYLNDDMTVSTRLSVIANQFMTDHIGNIVYATWMNKRWKVVDVSYDFPRVTLTLGGLYNGKTEKRPQY